MPRFRSSSTKTSYGGMLLIRTDRQPASGTNRHPSQGELVDSGPMSAQDETTALATTEDENAPKPAWKVWVRPIGTGVGGVTALVGVYLGLSFLVVPEKVLLALIGLAGMVVQSVLGRIGTASNTLVEWEQRRLLATEEHERAKETRALELEAQAKTQQKEIEARRLEAESTRTNDEAATKQARMDRYYDERGAQIRTVRENLHGVRKMAWRMLHNAPGGKRGANPGKALLGAIGEARNVTDNETLGWPHHVRGEVRRSLGLASKVAELRDEAALQLLDRALETLDIYLADESMMFQ